MRTMRLSLIGTVILSLIGGLNGAVMAQSEPEVATGPEHAWVTLVSEDCDFAGQDSSGEGDGFTWYHGGTYTCDLVFSDPRVSGTLTGVYSDNCFGAAGLPCVFWDSEEIHRTRGDVDRRGLGDRAGRRASGDIAQGVHRERCQ